MPIYEYRCLSCHRRFSQLFLSATAPDPHCPHCGGAQLQRLFSRFATVRSEEERLEALADPRFLEGLENEDPATIAQWARKIGRELGEDLGEDFEELAEEAAREAEAQAAGGPPSESEGQEEGEGETGASGESTEESSESEAGEGLEETSP